jgi:hypothetical protein
MYTFEQLKEDVRKEAEAQNANLISYLRGETDTLTL